ncbi:condensation domain-containing protein [Nonomuraea sp. NPDC050786]|uniref:condensation domain-containing protein n=1 Tax=Nonomuraea sp. NPDC050786 TaxID=3154840 RepID=UPI00340E3DBD
MTTGHDVPSYAQERRVRAAEAARLRGDPPTAKTLAFASVLPGRADVAALETAVNSFVARHGALQRRFHCQNGVVTIRRVTPSRIRCTVTETDSPPSGAEAVERLVRAEVNRPFDVLGWPLMRAGVIQSDRPVFYLSMDHLITDGWSLAVARRDIEALYNSALSGEPAGLPQPADFGAFAAEQRRRFAHGPALDREVAALRRLLGGRPVEPAFPVDARPWDLRTGRYVRIDLLSGGEADVFARRCRDARATVLMGVLAAVGIAMRATADQREAGMLVAMHNRDAPAIAESVGWYANTLPLYFPVGERFDDTLRAARGALMDAIEHYDLPIAQVLAGTPAGHYNGIGEEYPFCFVSFTDDRTATPDRAAGGPGRVTGARQEAWQHVHLAPSHRVGYGLWISLTDTGLLAAIASPDSPRQRDRLTSFETALADVVRGVAMTA